MAKFSFLTGLGIVGGLAIAVASASVQAQTEAIAPSSERVTPASDSRQTPPDPAAATSQTETGAELTCPPGQFASAFSDVLPTHWAYTAANQLASVPLQCFDLPDEVSRSRS